MKTPSFWRKRGLIPVLLSPVAAGYALAGELRQRWAHPVRAEKPVLCVGNLVAGGAGKTPTCLLVAELLRAHGKNPYLLSRGFGGRFSGPLKVELALHTADDVGDEALLLGAHFPTLVSRDRAAGAKKAAFLGAGCVILDDGFQNTSLAKTASLLVIDGEYGFGNGMVIPSGPLREPIAQGLSRADALLVVGDVTNEALAAQLAAFQRPVFHADLVPLPNARLTGQKLLAFAGIARPEKFFRSLKELGCDVEETMDFADHYAYTRQDIDRILARARRKNLLPVTTAKDAVRVSPAQRRQLEVLEVTLVPRDKEALTAWLLEKLA